MSDEETLETRTDPDGTELRLLRRGPHYEVRSGDASLMASDVRRCEQALVELVFAPLSQRDDVTVLLAGLGMGYTLRHVLDMPGVVRVDVVERSETIVDWNRRHFGPLNRSPLDDPRVHVHPQDLASFLAQSALAPPPEVPAGWYAIVLDLDNGPRFPTRPANAAHYTKEGLDVLEAAMRHGGVIGFWSVERDLEFFRGLHARFTNVAEMLVPVEVAGTSNLDYIYRGRRKPEARPGGNGNPAKA